MRGVAHAGTIGLVLLSTIGTQLAAADSSSGIVARADAEADNSGAKVGTAEVDAASLNKQDQVFKLSPQGLSSGDRINNPEKANSVKKEPVGNAQAKDNEDVNADPEAAVKPKNGEQNKNKIVEDFDPDRLGVTADEAANKDKKEASKDKNPSEKTKQEHANHDQKKTSADDAQLSTGKGAGTGGVGAKGDNGADSKAVFDALDHRAGEKAANASPQVLAAQNDEDDDHMSHMGRLLAATSMIVVSELGDKTFFIAALMAMKHPHFFVFTSSFGALAVMTLLSAYIGRIIPSLLSPKVTLLLAAILFLVFGARLLREGLEIDASTAATEELYDVEKEIELQEQEHAQDDAEKGGSAAAQASSSSPKGFKQKAEGLLNLLNLFVSPTWIQIFIMTFLGEWGDRSQIATVAMGAGNHFWPVVIGGLLGHAGCTVLAVTSGKLLASRLSLRTITLSGSICFLVFAVLYFYDWLIMA